MQKEGIAKSLENDKLEFKKNKFAYKEMLKMTRKQAVLHGRIKFNDNRKVVTYWKINLDEDRYTI